MQSLRDLALMMSEKKPTFIFFFLNKEISVTSLEHMCARARARTHTHTHTQKSEIVYCIHNLSQVINNCIKFQFNQIRTSNFQLKLFDTPQSRSLSVVQMGKAQ